MEERTLKKRGKEPRTRVPRCLVLGARYSAVVYSSSKTTTHSGCLQGTAEGVARGRGLEEAVSPDNAMLGKGRTWIGVP